MQRHPHHDQLRVYCSSGQVNGRPLPLPPLERPLAFNGDRRRSTDFAEKCRKAAFLAWEKRRVRV